MRDGNQLSTATGFFVSAAGQTFLVTNWHVVSGCRPGTNTLLLSGHPTHLRVALLRKTDNIAWKEVTLPLYGAQGQLWREHPTGSKVDLAALPVAVPEDCRVLALPMALVETDMIPRPGLPLFIVGFPKGFTAGGFLAIWKAGTIASEPEVDVTPGEPAFLIDARTHGGMSGSPVYMRMSGGYDTSDGNQILAGGLATRFMGVYAGRLEQDGDVGIVWRPGALLQVLPASPPGPALA